MFGIEEAMLNMSGLLIVNLPKKENSSTPLAVAVPMRIFCGFAQVFDIAEVWMENWPKKKLCEVTPLLGCLCFLGVNGMTEFD
ncbi:hypothetical protein N7519_010807 [Penicillium mononematosum]|uniref:uncharacterized protein n=1 Tax=Penicillium mononematosum TaxID=268346 RepID=UPI00254744F4|nr:uncharacterized protein N7519_010807 [Penicillium mononematosum]KAJ6180346.1 hypothetical protein N7519_010807 [Penicillium mononematosum]